VVQLYAAPVGAGPAHPPQQLAAFAKLDLVPGESRVVTLRPDPRVFSAGPGLYELRAGRSSRAIRSGTFISTSR
jgi:hypothetical protein